MTEQSVSDQEMTQGVAKVEEREISGELEVSDEVIASIAGVAAREIEGIASLGNSSIRSAITERVTGREERSRGVTVEAGRREAILDIDIRTIYGYNIPDLVVKVRENVARRLLEMVGLIAKEINIKVVGIEFPERMPGRLE